MPRPRGAKPTPRHKLASACPHQSFGSTPPQVAMVPGQLSYWLNNQYGDCVSAEEAFAIAAYSVLMGNPETFISDQVVFAFCQRNGLLNGADLLSVIQLMESQGMVQGGSTYRDGQPTSIDYTNEPLLQNAIAKGPVKLGVAAGQLENAVGQENGWFGLNFGWDQNEDHCVSLPGFGPLGWLCQQLNIAPPSGLNQDMTAYLLFTWKTIGIVSHQSIVNISGEAWLRTPTTVGVLPADPAGWGSR